jgi:hypothetical protein
MTTRQSPALEEEFGPLAYLVRKYAGEDKAYLTWETRDRLDAAFRLMGKNWNHPSIYSQFGYRTSNGWQEVFTCSKPISLRALQKIADYLNAADDRPQHFRDGQTPEQRRAQFRLIQGGRAFAT